MTNIASGNGNTNGKVNGKHITFYRTYSGLGLLISKAHGGAYIAIANDNSSSVRKLDLKFPSSESNCTNLNKWHFCSVTWSNKGENLNNFWSDGEKLITFAARNLKCSDYCYTGDFGIIPGWKKTHLTGCIGEIIAFYRTLNDQETSYIQEYLMRKWGITDTLISY